MIVGLGPAAVGGAATVFHTVPGTAAYDFEGALGETGGVELRFCFVSAKPVFTPFLHVATHVEAANGADGEFAFGGATVKITDGGGEGVGGEPGGF